jgi:hypothetical protein
MLDHLRPAATERIALALLNGIEDEQVRLLHKAIIHFKSAVLLYDSQLHRVSSRILEKKFRERQIHHMHATLKCLDGVSPMIQPSLLLMQALICGVSSVHLPTKLPGMTNKSSGDPSKDCR